MTSEQRPIDETANLLTHGFGLLLSLVAAAVLTWTAAEQEVRIIIACGVYSLTLILLYAASTLSHAFHDLRWRRAFRMLDQACIYLLIAGSFTPYAVTFLWHGTWRLLLVAMWVLAAFGVVLVLRLRNLTAAARFTYILLGWLPAVSLWELYQQAPAEVLVWLIAGGVCYSVGTIILHFDKSVRYMHAVWHTFVIAGSICHYVGVLVCIAPQS